MGKITGVLSVVILVILFLAVLVGAGIIRFQASIGGGAVGSETLNILRNVPENMLFEVDYMAPFTPRIAALNVLVRTAESVTDKVSVEMVLQPIHASLSKTYTIEDLKAVEEHDRSMVVPNTITIYILYVDGSFDSGGGRGETGAVSYSSTSFAVFATQAVRQSQVIEISILLHEFGHLMGLCELNYKSTVSRCENGHSTNNESVMQSEVKIFVVTTKFLTYDKDDLDDLMNLKNGTYEVRG
jgi:hypothetical protein